MFALFAPMALVIAVFSVLPHAGARGRARLAARDDDSLLATHEQLSQNSTPGMAVGFAGYSLVLALAQGHLGQAAAHVVVLAAAVLCLRASWDAARNVAGEMQTRALQPKPGLPRSARRQRRTRQIGYASFGLFALGGLLLILAPESSPLVIVAGAMSILSIFGLLALVIASVWVYGDEETDEPSRRT